MKKYDPIVYEKLVTVIREGDEEAQQWLLENGYPEIYHFWDAHEGIEKSFRWLLENNQRPLAAVIDGLSGKDQAKAWLLQNGYPSLAAFIDASSGSKQAVLFLLKAGEKGWIRVAHELHEREKKKEKNFFWNLLNFGNPFR